MNWVFCEVFNNFSNPLLQVSVWRRPTLSPTAVCMHVSNSARMGSNLYCIMWVPGPLFIIFPIRVCIDIISISTPLCPNCIALSFNCLYTENNFKHSWSPYDDYNMYRCSSKHINPFMTNTKQFWRSYFLRRGQITIFLYIFITLNCIQLRSHTGPHRPRMLSMNIFR
jgi:hypothetical protein